MIISGRRGDSEQGSSACDMGTTCGHRQRRWPAECCRHLRERPQAAHPESTPHPKTDEGQQGPKPPAPCFVNKVLLRHSRGSSSSPPGPPTLARSRGCCRTLCGPGAGAGAEWIPTGALAVGPEARGRRPPQGKPAPCPVLPLLGSLKLAVASTPGATGLQSVRTPQERGHRDAGLTPAITQTRLNPETLGCQQQDSASRATGTQHCHRLRA